MAAYIKMPLGMEVGLSTGDFVLDGDPTPRPQKGGETPYFWPMFIVAKQLDGSRCTWHGERPQPRRLCVKWGPSPPPKFSAHVYYSYCDFVRTLHRCKALLINLSFSILCILFLETLIVLSLSAMHSCTT